MLDSERASVRACVPAYCVVGVRVVAMATTAQRQGYFTYAIVSMNHNYFMAKTPFFLCEEQVQKIGQHELGGPESIPDTAIHT